MALNPARITRSVSPASSDGTVRRGYLSPLKDEDDVLKKDKAYRRYAAGIERALSLFETTLQEWADYISFLSRLQKALQLRPEGVHVIPYKAQVARRLAQCMNPTLPSGVHQKALEVYDLVFTTLDDSLGQALLVWFPGLASTLSFGSLSVRPLFLSLFDDHVVKLPASRLRPALKAILLALLPGLEEETSEDFERTLLLITQLRRNFESATSEQAQRGTHGGAAYFWQCLFLTSITSPSRRLGVLAYLTRCMPKLGDETQNGGPVNDDIKDDIAAITAPEPGLLLRCFAMGLADEQLLVQRNFLDLLVTHIPLNAPRLQGKAVHEDLILLVTAALGVVLRRDMSLNRRLWSWFLGPDPTSPMGDGDMQRQLQDRGDGPPSSHFTRHGQDLVVESLLRMIPHSSTIAPERARPFRIALSLMDRWEVGGHVIPAIFVPLMRSVKELETSTIPRETVEEVFRSANVFFDGVESVIIWSEIFQLLVPLQATKLSEAERTANAQLVEFITTRFNIREEEMLGLHIPNLILILVTLIREEESRLSTDDERVVQTEPVLLESLVQILSVLVDAVPQSAFATSDKKWKESATKKGPANLAIIEKIRAFYEQCSDAAELPEAPFSSSQIGTLVLGEYCTLCSRVIRSSKSGITLRKRIQILCVLVQKVDNQEQVKEADLGSVIQRRLLSAAPQERATITIPFSVILSLASLTIFLSAAPMRTSYFSPEQLSNITSSLVKELWAYLSPTTPQLHVEAATSILQLHNATLPASHVASALATLMSQPGAKTTTFLPSKDSILHFSVLWTHTINKTSVTSSRASDRTDNTYAALLERPLDLVIDTLSQPSSEGFEAAKEWLQSQPSITRIVLSVIAPLQATVDSIERQDFSNMSEVDLCDWQLRRVYYVLKAQSVDQWRAFINMVRGQNPQDSIQIELAKVCMQILTLPCSNEQEYHYALCALRGTSIDVLLLLLNSPRPYQLLDLDIDHFLVDRLVQALEDNDTVTQSRLISCLMIVLKLRISQPRSVQQNRDDRKPSRDVSSPSRSSLSDRRSLSSGGPRELLDCLLKGISAVKQAELLQRWIDLLSDSLPLLSDAIFQVILSIVEKFVERIQSEFEEINTAYATGEPETTTCSDVRLLQLLNGLEYCIAHAHDRLIQEEQRVPSTKSPEVSQGFFGNIVSGKDPTDSNILRNAVVNDRLTVILCFQDITKLAFSIWSWNRPSMDILEHRGVNAASFKYTVLKFRNRCRRILEHLVAAEPLEIIETLVESWVTARMQQDTDRTVAVLNLLHTLDGTRPRNTMPALFNASYSRSNPNAIDPTRKSSLTTKVNDVDLLTFLIVYGRSLEDDVLEEIWSDCMTFLRDILSNPMPHRIILPRLLEFVAVLSSKMENTNFGEERKMRRELGDLFTRLLTAMFTIKPPGVSQENGQAGSDDVVHILNETFSSLVTLVGDTDRLSSVISSISANVTIPVLKSRSFPENISQDMLALLFQMSKVPSAGKVWRRDVLEAFNDPKIFQSSPEILSRGWLPLLRQLVLADKDRLTEILSRIMAPTTAGIMFGVGAAAARQEADKKTQVNLRRIAALLLCAEEDTFASQYAPLLAKLDELLSATPITSPSSTTRAEIFMVFRTLILKSSSIHLAPLWPTLSMELFETFSSLLADVTTADDESGKYTPSSFVQAGKLLDVLLLIRPDDFQLQEWLFVTDTMDSIYPPPQIPQLHTQLALADEVGMTLQSLPLPKPLSSTSLTSTTPKNHEVQKPFLASPLTRDPQVLASLQTVLSTILRPFFSQLSIHAMESTYALGPPDMESARDDLLQDLVMSPADT